MPEPIPNNNTQKEADYQRELRQLNIAEEEADANFGQSFKKTANPYASAKPYSFDPNSTTDTNKNFERYYGHSSYERLNFNPWRDNETLYNEQGSASGDVERATRSGLKLMGTGFMSPLRSYADLLTGNAFTGDYESAQEMKYLNAVGSSSRGGAAGFTSNLITNSGYTFGLIGEMALESVAVASTFGAAAPVGLVNLGKNIKNLGKYTQAVTDINKGVKAVESFSAAKTFWQASKGIGQTALDIVNPLNNTVKAFKASKGLDALARASATAGGFYRDVQMANLTLAEAKLEGASTEQDTEEQLIAKYREDHGGMQPDRDELSKIKQAASDAGATALAWNIPTIFLTNKLTFEPLLKSFTKPTSFNLRNGLEVMDAGKKGIVEATFKNKFSAALKPKNWVKAPIMYFKENLSEGLQETAQEIIAGSARDYYKAIYNSSVRNGISYAEAERKGDNVWDVLSKNVADQFSGQGFETFASGFLMGGLIKPISSGISSVKDLTKSAEYKAKKALYASATLSKLNEINADVLKFYGSGIINMTNGAEAVKGQVASEATGDQKAWQDFEDQNVISNALTALDNNAYGIFQDKLEKIRSMTPEAITEAYGSDGQEVLSKIDSIINRADSVKKNYEKWNDKYQNPFTPNQYKKGTTEYTKEAIAYSTWENAKKLAIFNESSFQRNTERIQSITRDINQTEGLDGILATDISLLLTPQTIEQELSLLKSEMDTMEGDPLSRKLQDGKRIKRNRLQDFSDKLKMFYLSQAGATEEKVSKSQLKKAYQTYLKHLAISQTNVVPITDLDVDNSFQQLLDIHDLNIDNVSHINAINVLANPDGFVDQYKRLNTVFTDLYNTREELNKKAVENTQSIMEDNAILNVLFDRGFVVSPENAEKIIKNKTVPDEFYDQNAKQVVDSRDYLRFQEFSDIITNYVDATTPEPTPEEKLEAEIKQFVADIMAGVSRTSEEDIAFHAENKVAIEALLQANVVQSAPLVNPVVGKPELHVDIVAKFDAVKTEDQLDALEEELEAMMLTTAITQRKKAGLTSNNIEPLIKAKRQELMKNVILVDLEVGTIVMLNDGDKKAQVIDRSKNWVKLQDLENPALKFKVVEADLQKVIQLKYSKHMKADNVVPTADELIKAKENATMTEKNVIDDSDLLNTLLKEAYADEQKTNDEFLANIGCK